MAVQDNNPENPCARSHSDWLRNMRDIARGNVHFLALYDVITQGEGQNSKKAPEN